MARAIRPIAVCVFRHADRVLLARGHDAAKGERFRRPLGGAIEFGERAAEALRREIREEIGAEIAEPRLLGVLENVFDYDGAPGHEIVFVFDAEFRDATFYRRLAIPIAESVWIGPATWEPIDRLAAGDEPVYPDGLLALLRSSD